jgi:hypothetical protein
MVIVAVIIDCCYCNCDCYYYYYYYYYYYIIIVIIFIIVLFLLYLLLLLLSLFFSYFLLFLDWSVERIIEQVIIAIVFHPLLGCTLIVQAICGGGLAVVHLEVKLV